MWRRVANLRRNRTIFFGLLFIVFFLLLIPSGDFDKNILVKVNVEKNFEFAEDLIMGSNEEWEIQGWPGNGTPSSPYLIENMDFHFVSISNSSVFFIIQNCQFEDLGNCVKVNNGTMKDCIFYDHFSLELCDNMVISNLTAYSLYLWECNNIVITNQLGVGPFSQEPGVTVDGSVNVTIDRCYFEGFAWGVIIEDSFNCSIQNSTFIDCGYWPAGGAPYQGAGFQFYSCTGCIVQNNTFTNNYGLSFKIDDSEFCVVIGNFVDANQPSISGCEECSIINNTLDGGLSLRNSRNCNISWNELGVRGLKLYSTDLSTSIHTVSRNTLLGKPLQYIVNESKSNYSNCEYGQIILANSNQVLVTRSEVFDFGPGIHILHSNNCSISEVLCNSIIIEYSSKIEIQYSDIIGKGISTRESPETIMDNNTVVDSGISVFAGSIRSNISNNQVMNAAGTGIKISASECRIENNTVRFCTGSISACYSSTTPIIRDYGAIEIYSDDCIILNNSIIDNSDYGIWVTGDRNVIYQNTMIRNSLGNGLSSGQDNQWDNGIDTGNFWDDWLGFGVYNVPGTEMAIDRFPSGSLNLTENPGLLFLIGGFSGALIVLAIILLVKTGFVSRTQISTTQIRLRIQMHHELYP